MEKWKEFGLKWKIVEGYSIGIVLLLTLLAFVIRVYRLDFLSIWLDEAMHIVPAQKGEVWYWNNNGILLTWFNVVIFKLFGVSIFTARIMSVIFGAASVPLIYILGKDLFNKNVGLFSALLLTFSLFAIFWSRLDRNYALFMFSYLLLLVVVWRFLNNESDVKCLFTKKNVIWFIYLTGALFFAVFSHQLTFFIFFSVGCYALVFSIYNLIKKKKGVLFDIHFIISVLYVIGLIIFFTPLLPIVVKPILGIALNENTIDWYLPDWNYVLSEFKLPEKRMKSFKIYFNVLMVDFKYLPYFGIVGLILPFLLPVNRKGGYFLFCGFVVPFLLLSFVFREPALSYQLLFIYPLFLISVASFLYFTFSLLVHFVKPLRNKNINAVIIFVALFVISLGIPFSDIKSFILTKKHGYVVKKELFSFVFINWKQVCKQAYPLIKDTDVVLSTWPASTNFYLKRDDSIFFRQRHYDTQQRKYVNNKPLNVMKSAHSYEDLVSTIKNNERGWLFGDYYLQGPLTDPKVLGYIVKNLDYHFELGKDGDIKVFSWDHSKPRIPNNSLMIIGKENNVQASPKIKVQFKAPSNVSSIYLTIEAEGIDYNEAFFVINEKYTFFITSEHEVQHTNQVAITQYKGNRKLYRIKIDNSLLKEENEFQFGYNVNASNYDKQKGYVIYNLY